MFLLQSTANMGGVSLVKALIAPLAIRYCAQKEGLALPNMSKLALLVQFLWSFFAIHRAL